MLEFEGKVLSGWVNIARFLAEKYGKWKSSSLYSKAVVTVILTVTDSDCACDSVTYYYYYYRLP